MRVVPLSASFALMVLALACDGSREEPSVVNRPAPPIVGGPAGGNGSGGDNAGGEPEGGSGGDGGSGGTPSTGGFVGFGGEGGLGGGVPGCIQSGDSCVSSDICCDFNYQCILGECDLP